MKGNMRPELVVENAEEELDKLALKLFAEHEAQFTPTFPWVFVRVLPREHKVGSIWLPNNKSQNKPAHEGIVLKTWEESTTRECDYAPGDHVVYPHWVGLPIPGWDERYYRQVPGVVRLHRGIDWNGIIMGKLTYPRESVEHRIQNILGSTASLSDVKKILQDFDVIPKDLSSKTISGK